MPYEARLNGIGARIGSVLVVGLLTAGVTVGESEAMKLPRCWMEDGWQVCARSTQDITSHHCEHL